MLNFQQRQAVQFNQGPLLIVAAAGTGKTTVITERIAYLIKNKKAKPEEILALTFTDKAALEMEERVDKLLPYGYHDLWISTFHSFSQRILQEHGLDIGLPTNFKLVDQTSAWLLVKKNLAKFNLNYYKPLGNPTKFIHALITHFSRCKDQAIYPKDYLQYSQDLKSNLTDLPETHQSERIIEIAEAYHTYQKLLLENNLLDFGDLINYCLELFQKRPWILKKYREKFIYILIDEFQDTNWSQYELVKLLAAPKNNLTVCADDDQSIYKFRGASFSNVLQFRRDFPQAAEISLRKNYRSAQNILDLAYQFIQLNNPNRLEYLDKINKKLQAQKKGQAEISHLHFKNSDQEVAGVVNKIIEILGRDKKASLNDFAILVRTNDSANAFCRGLERARLDYQFLAARGLYTKPIILDVIAYFKLLDNYHENQALYRVLNLPCFKFSHQEIMKITQSAHRRAESIYESLFRLYPNCSLLNLIQKQTRLARQKNTSEIFVRFLEDSGYLEYLSKKGKKEDLDYLGQFYEKIKQFEETSFSAQLKDFMEQLNMELESGEQGALKFNLEQGPETIKIMTIHSAKGLEFKYVFLVNLVDKKFPTIERKEPIEIPEAMIKDIIPKGDMHLEEERRLFYVGLTRAKAGLFLTSAEDYGGLRQKKLSRFLFELGLKKLAVGQIKTKKLSQKISPEKIVLPPYFSFTQLKVFQNCPWQYKLAYILKIPIKGKAVFSFGKTMHDTLFEFVRQTKELRRDLFGSVQQQNVSFDQLMEIYQKKWISDWYEDKSQKENYYQLGKNCLKKFYQDFYKNKPAVLALEQDFKLKIAGETLAGRIDRIDKGLARGRQVEIIDYKTGRAKESLEPEDKEQLLIYQIAAEEVLGLKPKKMTYYYLEDSKEVSFLGSRQDLKKQKEKIISQIKQIKKSDFSATAGWRCQFCDFKEICEFKT